MNISINEFIMMCAKAGLIKAVYDSSGNVTGIADINDVPVTGLSSVPWAKFIVDSTDPTVGVDPSIACNYIINDREVSPGGGMPIFQINPLAAKKRSIVSNHLYVPDFANRPAATDFPGLPIMIGNFGGAIAKSDGTDWVAKGRQYVYNEQNGTITTPTKTVTGAAPVTFTSSIPNIPANLIVPGKTVLRINYTVLRVNGSSAGTIDFAIRMGTVGNASDPLVTFNASISATNNFFARGSTKVIFTDATHSLSTRSGGDTGAGTNLWYEAGPAQLDTASPLIIKPIVTAKAVSGDIVALLNLELIWER